jgi:hypothetical protein
MIRVDVTLKILGLKKGEESWWDVSTSTLSYAKPVIFNKIFQMINLWSIKDALVSPQKSTVAAKVLNVNLAIRVVYNLF